ncbi:MAG: ligase-associated DNA damage response endonuclease PdeM [Synechococcaceae cyanobacterium]|nr:ligase-associated DNA damage response endonuclease PdeM [Synechococcaceae cyanobacterium]
MTAAEQAPFCWEGQRFALLGERAFWDPGQRLLLVADLHLGKAETFQAHGIPLPSDGDADTLNALLNLAHRLRPASVLVLGDLIHGRLGLTTELREKLHALPALLGCPLRLIGGNHEHGSHLEGLIQEPAQAAGPLWLSHAPDPRAGLLNVCGHLHPAVVVGDTADRLRLPCFAFDRQQNRLVLPAFGRLTGGQCCVNGEELWLVAGGCVLPCPGKFSSPTPRRQGRAPRRRG